MENIPCKQCPVLAICMNRSVIMTTQKCTKLERHIYRDLENRGDLLMFMDQEIRRYHKVEKFFERMRNESSM